MDLTPALKAEIDALSHFVLLRKIRFAPPGDPYMQGAVGEYWLARREVKRAEDPAGAVEDSKALGWDQGFSS